MENENKKGLNVPPLRFPEFKGEWRKTSLGNCCTSFDYGLNEPAIDYDGVNRYLRITDINDFGHLINNEKKSPKWFSNDYLVNERDILLSRTGATVGKSYLYSTTDGKLYFAGYLIRAHIKESCSKEFIFQETQKLTYKKWVKLISARSGQPGINSKEYASFSFLAPNLSEQEKIGSLLSLIDQRIDAQRKTIEDLEKVCLFQSDGLLKLDPIVGTPLSKILFETNKYAKKDEGFVHVTLSKEGITPKTDRYNRDFLVKSEDKKYKITELNDICYNPANLKFGVISLNLFGKAIFSPIYVTFKVKEGYSPFFISLLLTNQRFINYIRRYEQGTVYERMAVNPSDFLKTKLVIPDFKRQIVDSKKIEILKEKIIKEKEILSALIMVKKYLLSHLFI